MGILSRFAAYAEKNFMHGFTPSSMRHEVGLWPIYFCITSGVIWAAVFGTYTLLYNPDSMILGIQRNEWYRNKNFHFFNISGVDLPCEAPIYRRPEDPDELFFDTEYFPKKTK